MFDGLSSSIGPGRTNSPEDVEKVQGWLNHYRRVWGTMHRLEERGFGSETEQALRDFQRWERDMHIPSGSISPGDLCERRLKNYPTMRPSGKQMPLLLRRDFQALTNEDYNEAAAQLECEARAIKAVAMEESNKFPFDNFGRVAIQFEKDRSIIGLILSLRLHTQNYA